MSALDNDRLSVTAPRPASNLTLSALVQSRGTPAHSKPCDRMGMEELCRHKERCKALIPDLLTICKTTYKVNCDDYVTITST